jgi:hypothetical protein
LFIFVSSCSKTAEGLSKLGLLALAALSVMLGLLALACGQLAVSALFCDSTIGSHYNNSMTESYLGPALEVIECQGRQSAIIFLPFQDFTNLDALNAANVGALIVWPPMFETDLPWGEGEIFQFQTKLSSQMTAASVSRSRS